MWAEELFIIKYCGRTIEIPKSSIKFQHGYAVVVEEVRKSHYISDGTVNIRGVIDENFETVYGFYKRYSPIKIFPEGNIIVTEHYHGGDGDQAYIKTEQHHYKINDKIATKVYTIESEEYDQINETTIKISNDAFLTAFEALYDVVAGKYISEKFTAICSFSQIYDDSQEKFAKAILRIPYGDKSKNNCDVYCYIDEKGNIRTPLYNPNSNTYIDTTKEDFNFIETINVIKAEVEREKDNKLAAENKLKELIVPSKNIETI